MTVEVEGKKVDDVSTVKKPYKMEIVWKNVLLFVVLHAAMIHGFCLKKKTISLVIGWTIGFMQGSKKNEKKNKILSSASVFRSTIREI